MRRALRRSVFVYKNQGFMLVCDICFVFFLLLLAGVIGGCFKKIGVFGEKKSGYFLLFKLIGLSLCINFTLIVWHCGRLMRRTRWLNYDAIDVR